MPIKHTFSIVGEPLTAPQVTEWNSYLSSTFNDLESKTIRYGSIIVCLLFVSISCFAMLSGFMGLRAKYFTEEQKFLACISTVLVVGMRILMTNILTPAEIAYTQQASNENILEIEHWCACYPACETYRQKVISQGRQFLYGEYLAMRDWVHRSKATAVFPATD